MKSKLLNVLLSAFGMFLGYWVASHSLVAKSKANIPANIHGTVVSAQAVELVDAGGRRQIVMATSSEGSPGIWFFDKNGKARLSMGLYQDNNAVIVLNDENEQAVQIFRTVGSESAPVLVMKAHGRDRIVMGLNSSTGQEPFLVFYDAQGVKHSVFGHY
jgi:hypothetical protein